MNEVEGVDGFHERSLCRVSLLRAGTLRGRLARGSVRAPCRPRSLDSNGRNARLDTKSLRRRPPERRVRVLLERRPVPARLLLLERTEKLAGVRGGGERHLSQGPARERGERLHEAGLTGRRGTSDDRHPTLRAAVRRSLQRRQLAPQKTQGVVVARAHGLCVRCTQREARVAHVQVTVAQGHRGRWPDTGRPTERLGEELDALDAITRCSKPLREESLKRGINRAVKVPVVHCRSFTREVAPSE